MSLIETLNKHIDLTPDEIVAKLQTGSWMRWLDLTQEFCLEHQNHDFVLITHYRGGKNWTIVLDRFKLRDLASLRSIQSNFETHVRLRYGTDCVFHIIPYEEYIDGQFPENPFAEAHPRRRR